MRKSVDFGLDDHPADDDERLPAAWAVAIIDDCDGCDDLRVELTLERRGEHGGGVAAHLSPDTARRVRTAIGTALKELGEDPR